MSYYGLQGRGLGSPEPWTPYMAGRYLENVSGDKHAIATTIWTKGAIVGAAGMGLLWALVAGVWYVRGRKG
jgi:hypothetical protein